MSPTFSAMVADPLGRNVGQLLLSVGLQGVRAVVKKKRRPAAASPAHLASTKPWGCYLPIALRARRFARSRPSSCFACRFCSACRLRAATAAASSR